MVTAVCIVACAGLVSAMPPVQRSVLPNGLVLLTSEETSLPFVTCSLLIQAGARRDPAGREGLANLTARALLFGTRKQRMASINEQLDFMGASLSSEAGRDYSVVSFRVLKKDLAAGFRLLMEVLTEPAFPDDEVRKEVTRTLATIKASEDDPGEVAEKAFLKALHGTGPYSYPVAGTRESVERLTAKELADFYHSAYVPNNAVMVVVGDIEESALKGVIMPRLEQWEKRPVEQPVVTVDYASGARKIMIDRPLTQANLILGHKGITRGNPDFYAVTVMNFILGGGSLNSRLMEEIRDKRGLAYSVFSHFAAGKYEGLFEVVLQTKNASAAEAIRLAVREMSRMRTEVVSDDELQRAKKYLIGSFPLRFTSQGKIAGFLMQVEYQGLGFDYVEQYPKLIGAVTAQDVQRVAQKYLHPDTCILVAVGNLKEAGLEQ
jgi:zinc protease